MLIDIRQTISNSLLESEIQNIKVIIISYGHITKNN